MVLKSCALASKQLDFLPVVVEELQCAFGVTLQF